jgi:hypothetical protein
MHDGNPYGFKQGRQVKVSAHMNPKYILYIIRTGKDIRLPKLSINPMGDTTSQLFKQYGIT